MSRPRAESEWAKLRRLQEEAGLDPLENPGVTPRSAKPARELPGAEPPLWEVAHAARRSPRDAPAPWPAAAPEWEEVEAGATPSSVALSRRERSGTQWSQRLFHPW